jgi:hypothetical protein
MVLWYIAMMQLTLTFGALFDVREAADVGRTRSLSSQARDLRT